MKPVNCMKVTEHNLSEWKLNELEIRELIRLAKDEMIKNSGNKAKEMFYGMIVGKLLIMKND